MFIAAGDGLLRHIPPNPFPVGRSAAPGRQAARGGAAARGHRLALVCLAALLLLAAGCEGDGGREALSSKAKLQWEQGRYADAARNFVTVAETDPEDSLAEESLFWAANLYHHFLDGRAQAIRYYQQLLVQFPEGRFGLDAQENLALLYEQNKGSRHRALQIYRQLLLNEAADKREYFQFKIATLNLEMGIMDQARFEFRELLTKFPTSEYLPEAYYLIGYSYFLEKRYPLALTVFNHAIKDFPDNRIAIRAQFFIAEIQEEQGNLKEALKLFRTLEGKYHSKKILQKRIASLKARMKKGVR